MEKIDNIIKELDKFKYKYNCKDVFADCIEYTALQVANMFGPQLDDELKDRFEHVFDSYSEEDKSQCMEIVKDIKFLLAEFGNTFDDYLGKLYMRVVKEYSKVEKDQYFTPYEVSKMMAKMMVGDGSNLQTTKKPYQVLEPCCGSGVMCIAMLDELQERQVNYLQDVLVVAGDIDKTCVYMTFLQMSFIGASAIVEQKDALSDNKKMSLKTLGYYLQKEHYHRNNKNFESE